MEHFLSPQNVLAGGTSRRRGHFAVFAALALATFLGMSAPAQAGSIEVTVRDPQQRPWIGHVFLHPPVDAEHEQQRRLARLRGHQAFTDRQGVATFTGLPPGRYTVSLPGLPDTWLQPSENPAAPAPVLTLFDDEEKLRALVELQIAVPIAVHVDLPEEARRRPQDKYLLHTVHRESGFHRSTEMRPHVNRVRRMLSQGIWDVWIDAPPGQLLVDVVFDRRALRGSVATLQLAPAAPPGAPELRWVAFRYESPATIEGDVIVKSGARHGVEVVATIVAPGEWFEAAEFRGGSIYSPVSTEPGPGGHYRLVLPDGLWQVSLKSEKIVAIDPPRHLVEARVGEPAEADFEVELDEDAPWTFRVHVLDPAGHDVEGAIVRLVALDDPGKLYRQGKTEAFGIDLDGIPKGDYLLLAGHADYLEAGLELYDVDPQTLTEVRIPLVEGGDLYLSAVDLEGRPARGVEWTIEHLDPPLEIRLKDPEFLAAKTRRIAVTDDSGRVRVEGLYGGFYRLRAERPARVRPGRLFHVGRTLEHVTPSVELYLPEQGTSSAWARQQPAANLWLELVCDDNRPPPAEASVFVIDLDAPAHDVEAALAAAVLVRDASALAGRRRDHLLVGPLGQGVYRLALRPEGFVRWTWAFQSYEGEDSFPIQIDIDEKEPAALVDLGPFPVECAPAVDLVPRLAEGELPDMRDVEVSARLLDPEEEREIAAHPDVVRRGDRAELRLLPRGPMRLAFVLSHPHFLPAPDLAYEVALDLERGRYVVVAPEIAALGGAVRVEPAGGASQQRPRLPGQLVRARRDDGTSVDMPVEPGAVLVPSLVPGLYEVTLCQDEACETPVDRWESVEVRRASTVPLESRGADPGH